MDIFKNILYPTDFSTLAEAALPYALNLVRQYQARLHCLHVVDVANAFYRAGDYIAPELLQPVVQVQNWERHAREQLERFAREHLQDIPELVTQVATGKPFAEIIRYARDQNIDLIVMGTHGHSAVSSMLLGSVAEKVVRKSSCPTLTIRHPEHKFVMP